MLTNNRIGISITISDLVPMHWIVTDLMSIQDKEGTKKIKFIVIGDKTSYYIWAKKLLKTKAKHINN